jgi:hypothetical protein
MRSSRSSMIAARRDRTLLSGGRKASDCDMQILP